MKKLILATAVLALAGMNPQTARAGNSGWAVTGSVFIGGSPGVAIGGTVNSLPSCSVAYAYGAPAPCPPPRAVVYTPAPVVCLPPVVYVRPPIVVYHAPVVCAPPPVVKARYAYRGGRGHGYGHYRY